LLELLLLQFLQGFRYRQPSLEPKARRLTPLFNPRRHKWGTHFRWQGAYLIDRTPIGRVTIALLHINDDYRVGLREELIADGLFPPA
jgi:hypothetical protein